MSDGERGEKLTDVSREGLTWALLRDSPAHEVDLPDDVEIEELWHHPDGHGYRIRISSSEWGAVEEGEALEMVNPTITEALADE